MRSWPSWTRWLSALVELWMAIPFLNRERLNNELNFEKAEVHVRASLREGADLRLKFAGNCGRQIVEAALLISDCLAAGDKLLLFGNGGSAADATQ